MDELRGGKPRCAWCLGDPLYERYHDEEWGVPLRDDRALFELLILEGAQAGLSWRTILHKRENYRRAFAGFDPAKVARFGARERKRLLADAGIVRNRLKIDAAIGNAQAWLRLREEEGGAVDWLWSFVGGKPKAGGISGRKKRIGGASRSSTARASSSPPRGANGNDPVMSSNMTKPTAYTSDRVVALAPANMPKAGPGFDLAMAVSIVLADKDADDKLLEAGAMLVPSTRTAPIEVIDGVGATLATVIVCSTVVAPPSSSATVRRTS